MKFTVQKREIYNKLQKLSRSINQKNTLPILSCFLFGVKANKLYLISSDQEIRMTTSVDIEHVEGEGNIAIDANMLLSALRELPDQNIIFKIDNESKEVSIDYGNGKYNFIGQNGDEYPEIRELDEKLKHKLVIPSVDLHNIILGTLFASAIDELRPVMEGIYFDINEENMTFVASDGHKLARLVSDIKGQERASFILPKKGADVIRDLVSKESDDVIINFDLNNANFKIGDYNVNIRFIEGRYPNYNSVIPKEQSNRLELNRDTLIAILKRVSVFSNKQSNLVAFDISSDTLTVTAQDHDYSIASEESTNINYSGIPMKIGFKSTFLLEILKNISSDEIILSFSDPTKATLITPVYNTSGLEQTSLLMPMMLSD